jgi:peptidoglycan-N-acetylglucosamine deacetylase
MFGKLMKKACLYLLFTVSAILSYGQILRKPIPDKLVVLTFDDGVKSHSSIVAPLLKQYNFGATFYVCEFPPNFSDTSKYMTWNEIKQLHKMGFEVASHTKTHKHVNKMKKEELVSELEYIENKCRSLKIPPPKTFAYPGYDVHPIATETLKEKGYSFARTGGNRVYDPTTDHPYLVPSFTTTKTNKQQIMDAFKQASNGKVVVLTVHGVPDYEHDWVTTPLQLFNEYLEYLHNNHYKVIAMKDLSKYVAASKALQIIQPDYSKKMK